MRSLLLAALGLAALLALWFAATAGGGEVQAEAASLGVEDTPAPELDSTPPPPPQAALVDVEGPARAGPAIEKAPELRPAPVSNAQLDLLAIDTVSGAPLIDQRVEVALADPRPGEAALHEGASWVTDANGRVRLEVPPHRTLSVTVLDDKSDEVLLREVLTPLPTNGMREHTLRISSGLRWFGQARDANGPEPGYGARVRLVDPESIELLGAPPGPPLASLDGKGLFSVRVPLAARLGRLDGPGWAPLVFPLTVGHDRTEDAAELLLRRAASLTVTVADEDGTPMAGIGVELIAPASAVVMDARALEEFSRMRWSGRTDAAGSLRWTELPPDTPLLLQVGGGPGETTADHREITLRAGEATPLAITRTVDRRLTGAAHARDGSAAASVELWLVPASARRAELLHPSDEPQVVARTRTDDEGRFSLGRIPAGAYWLGPAPSQQDQVYAPRARWFELPEKLNGFTLNLELQPALWLTGRVVTRQREPAAGVRVIAHPLPTGRELSCWSGDDGRFKMGPVASSDFELFTEAGPGHAGSSVHIGQPGRYQELVLRPAGAVDIVGIAEEGEQPGELRLVVTDAAGGVTLANGSELAGLPEGSVSIVATDAQGRAGLVTGIAIRHGVRAGETLLSMTSGAMLELPREGLWQAWRGDVCLGETQGPASLVVPAGELRLTLDGELAEQLEVTAGEVRAVD